jgi:hypothetical protein
VPAYSGSSFPYWMNVQGNGATANGGAVSEDVPVTPGTSYTFSVSAAYAGFFSGGYKLTLSWFTVANSLISFVTATSGAMSPDEVVSVATASTAAPSNAAYATATITLNGTPAASNALSVFAAAVAPSGQPAVNLNYAFVWSSWPWAAVNSAVLSWQADQVLLENSDSLVLDGVIELMGGAGGAPCQVVPELLDSAGAGPRFRILAPPSTNAAALGYQPSYDLNAPQPTQDVVASMLLDGERPFGYRASNRTITLPVIIFGTALGGMKQVLAAREYLMSVIDQQVFQVTWTSADTGLPLVYDCFRALPSVPVYSFNYSAGGTASNSGQLNANAPLGLITLTIQALPYGRSDIDGVQSLSFINPIVNSPVPPSSQVVDAFGTVTGGQGWVKDTTKVIAGTASIRYDAPVPLSSPYPAATYARTLGSAVNMTGLTALSVWLGQAYDTQWPAAPSFTSNTTLAWTLTDGSGNKISFSSTSKGAAWGAVPSTPRWTLVTAPVPQGNNVFQYGSVTAYSVTVTNWTGSGNAGYVRLHCWLNDLTALPQTVASQASPRGNLYSLYSLPGSARAPVNVQCQLPAAAPVTQELTTPASGSWIVPGGVYQVEAECWGAGGAGATVDQARATAGAGGGGGEYAAEPVLAVTPGTAVPYSIGQGGTPAQVTETVSQLVSPGLHSWTAPSGVTSVLVECWGAGAAGAAGSGGGGAGAYSSATETVVPGTAYNLSVGAGGLANTGTTAADNAARNGGPTWFGSATCTTLAAALVGANGGTSPVTGGSNGGSGGSTTGGAGTTVNSGGNGGHAPGGGGGGGGGAGWSGGRGHHGHSPASYGFGAAWTGSGQGGSSQGQGGGGGGGSSCPGTPAPGGFPGGGGGGGFSGAYFTTVAQGLAASLLPGNSQVNYMGANGANGMVQLTYAVGNGSPVNGGNTVFGSAATTATTVTAHGGSSAALNASTGATGGSGSSNTAHSSGAQGGLSLLGAQGSWMLGPQVSSVFQTLGAFSYSAASHTSGGAASSCSQGGAMAVVQSASPVTDLSVQDSAGNVYLPVQQQGGGAGGTTGCVYVFAAAIVNPVTTSTTLTVSSATSQQYGAIWYASAWLTDVTGNNGSSSSGTGTSLSGQFGTADNASAQYEIVVAFNATNQSFNTPTFGGKLWYAAGSTSSLVSGSLSMQVYAGLNEAGGTGSANGDAFAQTIGGSSSWAVVCVPFFAMSQQAYAAKLDFRTGTTPGASTTWGTDASISANGMIAFVGMAGSGSSITAGPTAVTDQGGNAYTIRSTVAVPASGGVIFAATAPVTAAMAQGASGTVSWGHASAAPNYWTAAYWIPNATGYDGSNTYSGTGVTANGTYVPSSTAPVALAVFGNAVTGTSTVSGAAAPWNYIDTNVQSYLDGQTWAAQVNDRTNLLASGSLGISAPWALLMLGLSMSPRAQGGGAAGGPVNAGYPATFYAGGPGYTGGGKGGLGAQSLNTAGGGASLPGGGGGGSYGNSGTVPVEGGQGGQGAIRLTYPPPLVPFNTLIVHRPGQGASPNLNPLVAIPVGDVPNNTEYTVANVVQPAANAAFNSTYTVLLANHNWNAVTIGLPRTIVLTVNQYEYPGGPASSSQVSRTVVPATDIVNGIVNMGEVTLPLKDYAKFNDQSYFTVSINDTDQSDRFMDVLFLDTTGQTVCLNIDPSQPGYNTYVNYYIDEPTPDRDLGFIGGTCQDRQHNVSLMEYAFTSGGPLYISAGSSLLLAYSPSGAPNIGLSYAPRWMLDRIV